MSELELKLLDPSIDLPLFKEAYQWRQTKKHVQPDRAPFEAFISDDPKQIVIGVFNGEFLAAFVLYEWKAAFFEAHFTSRRGACRESLVEGGRMIRDAFLQNGAVELCGWVVKRNRAMGKYLEDLGFQAVEEKTFPCADVTEGRTLPADTRVFVKYAVSRKPPSG